MICSGGFTCALGQGTGLPTGGEPVASTGRKRWGSATVAKGRFTSMADSDFLNQFH